MNIATATLPKLQYVWQAGEVRGSFWQWGKMYVSVFVLNLFLNTAGISTLILHLKMNSSLKVEDKAK